MLGIILDYKMINNICFCKTPCDFSQSMNSKCVYKLNSLVHELTIYLCKVLTDIDITVSNCCSMSHWYIEISVQKSKTFSVWLRIKWSLSNDLIYEFVKCRHLQQIAIIGGTIIFKL
jgi:hypothetical protein